MTEEELKKKQAKKERLIADLFTSLFTFIFGGIIFLIYFFSKDRVLLDAINGCSLAAIVIIGVALLVLVARLGAFDTFAYGFKQLWAVFFTKNPRKYSNYSDYLEHKHVERQLKGKFYIPMLFTSIIFIIATIILRIIYSTY